MDRQRAAANATLMNGVSSGESTCRNSTQSVHGDLEEDRIYVGGGGIESAGSPGPKNLSLSIIYVNRH